MTSFFIMSRPDALELFSFSLQERISCFINGKLIISFIFLKIVSSILFILLLICLGNFPSIWLLFYSLRKYLSHLPKLLSLARKV